MIETIRFNLHSIRFSPVKGHLTKNSKDILEEVLGYVRPFNLGNKVYIVDRHKKRKNSNPRELYVDAVVYDMKEKRYKCRIVLIRSGRAPMIKPHDTYELISIKEIEKLGSLVEVTHFYVDMNKPKPYIFVEFNSVGPRASDIEFYFRNVAHDVLKIAKETSFETFLDVSLDKVLDNIKDVLNFEIKIDPQDLESVEKDIKQRYFSGLSTFGRTLKTRFLNIKASFEVSERNGILYDNKEAKTMLGRLIRSIRNNNTEISAFKNFAIEYVDQDGISQDINLIKDQRGFEIDLDLKTLTSNRLWYEAIKDDIDEVMKTL